MGIERQRRLLITVDCDLRADDVGLRQASLSQLLQVFSEAGAAGHATWFLNENDFEITSNHAGFVREALRRGDTLGVHDHFEPFRGVYEVEPIQAFCARSKRAVEGFLAAEGYPGPMIYHRNGCLVQQANVYRALRNLGYTVVSEVWPGHALPDRAGRPAFDNTAMPMGVLPYRHGPESYADHASATGHFLHFPVMHMGLRGLDFREVERWIEAFSKRSIAQGMYMWLFHPYEIMNRERTGISAPLVCLLRAQLEVLVKEYGMVPASMAECRDLSVGKE